MDLTADFDPTLNGETLMHLAGQHRYGRYCEDRGLAIEGSRQLVLDEANQFLGGAGAQCVSVRGEDGRASGVVLFRQSDWDTEHFGYKVAIIDSIIAPVSDYFRKMEVVGLAIDRVFTWSQECNVRFLSAKISSLDLASIHALEERGFRFMESWIYNCYDLEKTHGLGESRCELRKANPEDYDVMLEYSKGAFVTHRFHADPNITADQAEGLYEKWIHTAFDDPTQEVLVMEDDEKQSAFMIYYKKDLRQYFGRRYAMWKMALLDPNSRGKGVGSRFFLSVMCHHKSDGLDVVDSGLTLRNLHSLSLHNKLGFKVVSTVAVLHKWMNE